MRIWYEVHGEASDVDDLIFADTRDTTVSQR